MNPSKVSCGFGVYVRGELVAWFPEFGEKEREWCTENYFGEWLICRSTIPEKIQFTEEEQEKAQQAAAEILGNISIE